MIFPTEKEVKEADHTQICRWYRFLPSWTSGNDNKIMARIVIKYNQGGGMTTAISKQIGWEQ